MINFSSFTILCKWISTDTSLYLSVVIIIIALKYQQLTDAFFLHFIPNMTFSAYTMELNKYTHIINSWEY